MTHKAGFVNIIGKPNAGKSTLMNALVGERMSIITPKAQTTRHRILGILNTPSCQIVFSDTPGFIEPQYGLQKAMMSVVNESFVDGDMLLLTTDIHEKHDESTLIEKVKRFNKPFAVLINKVDLSNQEETIKKIEYWKEILHPNEVIPISALHRYNMESVLAFIENHLPVHPPYFDKDALTDRPERFFVSEIIREKIFEYCHQEVPYSSEVIIAGFKELPHINRIKAEIIVERESQKVILLGKNGAMMKKIASKARLEIEAFTEKKAFLEIQVKVVEGWRSKEHYLTRFGY